MKKPPKKPRISRLDTRDQRTCLAIMPFNFKIDPTRGDTLHFDTSVYDNIIAPAVRMAQEGGGLKIAVSRVDKFLRAGSIHERMIQFIADADVAIVDLTTDNPNVIYELGVRHALRDRVTVLIRRRGTKSAFNIAGLATIDYDEKQPHVARRTIAAHIRNGLLSGAKDSLVYRMLPELRVETRRAPLVASDVEKYDIPGSRRKTAGRRLFVCYRRADTASEAGRLKDAIASAYGPQAVFIDIEGLRLGTDFVKAIEEQVATCAVVIVMIGRNWLKATGRRRRLDDPADMVRAEIASALRQEIPVIPVLVQDAAMPAEKSLPEDVRQLARRTGIALRHDLWREGVERLLKELDLIMARKRPSSE
jgi:TIR domain